MPLGVYAAQTNVNQDTDKSRLSPSDIVRYTKPDSDHTSQALQMAALQATIAKKRERAAWRWDQEEGLSRSVDDAVRRRCVPEDLMRRKVAPDPVFARRVTPVSSGAGSGSTARVVRDASV